MDKLANEKTDISCYIEGGGGGNNDEDSKAVARYKWTW